ncbi:MAG: amino acid adenylation domain-containing protein, partial [bacterium]|nr:amino acid adenylation domain-containing protein [bacterium]
PIGRPLPGRCGYVVDRSGRPVAAGVAGELCLGGELLARGYLGRPALSAARFVPDPFAAGGRLYRTGDLVRFRADGNLDFLGRVDHQVKVRGFRIELGETEAVLAGHPGVREAAVVTAGGQLVAYFAAAAKTAPVAAELKRFLTERLPAYMVPSAIVTLETLPFLPNGKVDRAALGRRALPAPETRSGKAWVAPGTPIEELLAGLWAEVMEMTGDRCVGLDDDFFELGGHSLLATQLVSRIRNSFAVELSLSDVFAHPRLADLAALIAGRRSGGAPPLPALRRLRREGPPLSFAQQRLWFLHQLEPRNPEYNIPAAIVIEGPLDVARLGHGLDQLVRRHETLRTRFGQQAAESGEEPVQLIDPPRAQPLPLIDLAALPPAPRTAELRRLIAEEAVGLFDLARGPLLRTRLLRLAALEHVFLLNKHHIVSDGWSTGILIRELGALYAGRPLPELAVRYSDFALWQRQHLRGEERQRQLDYWRRRLAGAPVVELPGDRPRPAVRSGRGGNLALTLPGRLREALEALSRERGATLFMTFLAAFVTLLYRYTGQRDVVVGTPIAGRRLAEVEGLIGFFVNTLVLRSDLSERTLSWKQLLEQVREIALESYAHQDLPFEQLVEELQPRRDRSRTPLFQVMFALQNAPLEPLELAGLTLRPLVTDSGTSKFDLTVALVPVPGGLAGAIEYAVELFDTSTIARLARHFENLLDAIVARPEERIENLELLAAAERWQLAGEWNVAPVPAATAEEGLHQPFEAQVRRTPEAVALVFDDQRLSYGELDARADRLAERLRGLGVGPEVLVGIATPRTPELVVAILAVLKAGGAYVPIDPSYPQERREFMLEDSGATVLLEAGWQGQAEGIVDGTTVVIPSHKRGDRPRLALVSPDALAYVIYTSGSTGRAKGVAITHRSALALVDWAREAFARDALHGVLASTSICFDISIFELFVPLSIGGKVILAENALALPQLDARAEVTLINTVPSAMAELVDQVPASVKIVNLAGEPLSRHLVQQIPVADVRNLYGPSEDTTYSTWCRVEEEGKPSIGRPLPGTSAWVVDRGLRPVPVGVPGELCLGGPGLARGYLARPALTAERFIPDPADAGERLYRTGDLVRYLPDGRLDFLGRIDHQVKIRGFRIELGEIEVVLASHPAVTAAVVLAQDQRLVAYVVGETAELRGFLAERLPGYMVPAAFVALEKLPLLPNGKVDRAALGRRALPAPEGRAETESYMPPRTPAEEVLAGIWSEVLGVDQVGIYDDFFALGGHSLLATRVLSRIRRAFGSEPALSDFFDAPRIAELAMRITGAPQAEAPITTVPRGEPLPASFAQQRLWLLHQLEPWNPEYHMPAAVAVDGPLDVALLARDLDEIVRRHETLRTHFGERGGEENGSPVQVIDPPRPQALPVIDLTALPADRRDDELRRLRAEDAVRLFDLARGPLLRTTLLRLDREQHVFLLNQHHVVSDGWSLGLLIRELAGRRPALPVQYADFAVWQRRWLEEVREPQLDYWRRRLAGAAALELPADRPRPAVRSGRGRTLAFTLPGAVEEELEALSRRSGATLFMTLLAAFQTLLHRYSGQDDVVVGTPIAGRRRTEVEDLIGCFVNTLVLRADLAGDPAFVELLGRVRRDALQAFSHQDLPFEQLVEDLQPQRDRSRTPLYQVMFVFQNVALEPVELEGLTLRPLPTDGGTSKFDLTLTLVPGSTGAVEYSTDLFDAATIVRLTRHFEHLLGAVAARPEDRIRNLALLSPAERWQLAGEWNVAPVPVATAAAGLHQPFAAQAQRTPEAVALVFGHQRLSYAELDARADQLANRLRRLGVGPEVLVGIATPRTPEMVVSILAVLKAGGAYVPIDPAYPRERREFMLEDSGAAVLLTDKAGWQGQAEGIVDGTIVMNPSRKRGDRPRLALVFPVSPDSLAYVIYTSGSTGRAKGVAITHRNALALVDWAREAFARDALHGVLASTSICFDISIFELFVPLAVGGKVILAENALALPQLDARDEVTLVNTVPSAMAEIVGR